MAGTMSKIISELDDATLDAVLSDGDEWSPYSRSPCARTLRQVTLNVMKQILGPLFSSTTPPRPTVRWSRALPMVSMAPRTTSSVVF